MTKATSIPIPELARFPLAIIEKRHAEAVNIPPHTHDANQILYIVGGSGTLTLGSAEYPLNKGDIAMLTAHDLHMVRDNPGEFIHLYTIYFTPELYHDPFEREEVAGFFAVLSDREKRMSILGNPFLSKGGELIREMLYEQSSERTDAPYRMKLKLTELLLMIRRYREEHRTDSRLVKSVQSESEERVALLIPYIESHYFRSFSLAEVAENADLSARQFSRIFKSLTGHTFTRYVSRIRVEKAKALLLEQRTEVTTVAFEVGFENLPYFYKVFKRETGFSPKSFIAHNMG